MIIECNNCKKKFEVDDALIPINGRLLQCNLCNHKWFFKNEILHKPISSVLIQNLETTESSDTKIDKFTNPDTEQNDNDKIDIPISDTIDIPISDTIDIPISETIDTLNDDKNDTITFKEKKIKKFKTLNLIIVFIISFVALIILIDTFKQPIGKFYPNIEFLLYNLYESFKDMKLFLNDLI